MFSDYVVGKLPEKSAEEILLDKFSYYKLLNEEQRKIFLTRLDVFLNEKKFVARNELQLTNEMRCLISACAIQLTLGLNDYRIESFEYILVYPDVYVHPHTKNSHHGETNMAGFLCFSWKSVLTGLQYSDDNFNVGLHEWSHALRFNSIKGNSKQGFFDLYFPKVMASGAREYQKIKSGRPAFMRSYAGSNINEFYAVGIEYFFESPGKFRKELPVLFEQFCILLNQEPRTDRVFLDVRESLLEFKPHFLHTQLLAKGTSNGGLFAVLPFFMTFLAVAAINFFRPSGSISIASLMLLIALSLPLFILPKIKSLLIFKEGILLSWMLRGIFRKDPLLISYDQMIQVEFYLIQSVSGKTKCESMRMSYYNNKSIRELELDCNLSETETHTLTRYLRERYVNVNVHQQAE